MMEFDRFDICEAHYVFAMLFHGGQGCAIYSKFAQLDRIKFRPSPLRSKPSQLSLNAKEIYLGLVHKHCGIQSTNPPA